jgi:hypothetical protein
MCDSWFRRHALTRFAAAFSIIFCTCDYAMAGPPPVPKDLCPLACLLKCGYYGQASCISFCQSSGKAQCSSSGFRAGKLKSPTTVNGTPQAGKKILVP